MPRRVSRRLVAASLLIAGATFTLLTLPLTPTAPQGLEPRALHYTLPSLDDVIRASADLDLQRVLWEYKMTNGQPSNASLASPRIILASTWRSGSTLLGEVVGAAPGVMYHYEPFSVWGVERAGPSRQDEVTSLLDSLFKCDYRGLDDYLRFAFSNSDIFLRNTHLWKMCSAMPRRKCYSPDILGKMCAVFPIHLTKLVRIRLSLLEDQIRNPNVKIVWLVRDPRAVMNSRVANVNWCKTPSCRQTSHMCSDLQSDLVSYLAFKEKFPDRIMLLRYEDLAKDAYNKSSNLLAFLGLSLHPHVVSYLEDHLNTNEDVPWSTRHDPRVAMSRWMKTMSWKSIQEVQYACAYPMKPLGYRLFESEGDLSSGNHLGLLNLPI